MTVSRLPTMIWLVCCLTAIGAQEPSGRSAVPNAAAQAKAEQLIRDVYGKELEAAKTPEEQTALAKKLLDQAANSKADPASHFVLLRFAKEVAVLAGDAESALEAVDRIIQSYEVDPIEMRLDCLETVAKAAKSSSQRAALAEQAFSLIDAAVAEDDFEAAVEMGELARESALKAREFSLAKQIVARLKEVEKRKEAYGEYEKAMTRLRESPTDAEANLAAGRFLCVVKGDWDRGIPMLALGGDAGLKAVATKELEGAPSPEAQVALGDSWWDLGDTRQGDEKTALLLRAGYWYELAQGNVTSALAKVKLQKRLEEIAKIEPTRAQTSPERAKSDTAFEVKSGVHFVRQAKRGLRVRIFASGCNRHQICLNGMPLMKCGRDTATTAAATLKEGDVLAVKLGDRFDVMSLWMMFLTWEGEYLFETSDKWTAYLPQNEQRWWDVQNIRAGSRKAEYAPDSRQYVDRVKKAAQQSVADYPKAQPIYSPVMGADLYGDAYLYYVVTVEDLLPKQLKGQAGNPRMIPNTLWMLSTRTWFSRQAREAWQPG